MHVDYVAEVVHKAVPGAAVVGLPDAGVFLDHNTTTGAPSYTPNYQWVAAAQNVTPSVDAGCVAHYAPAEQWRCFMAQYTIPFLSTPTFFAQDRESISKRTLDRARARHALTGNRDMPRATPRPHSRRQLANVEHL